MQWDDSSSLGSYLDHNVPHLDPIHSTTTVSSRVNAAIFEGLYHYHYFKRPFTLEPLLADGMPEISADGLKYRIKLKKGVLFQDDPAFADGKGRELTVKDVIFSWKRLADPQSKALGWWFLDGVIEWEEENYFNRSYWNNHLSGHILGLAAVGSLMGHRDTLRFVKKVSQTKDY